MQQHETLGHIRLPKKGRLTIKRLILDVHTDSDAQAIIDLLTNEEITRSFMVPVMHSFKEQREVQACLFETNRSAEHFEYAIRLKSGRKMIGFVNDCAWDASSGICELGYVIHPSHKGRGYATEAPAACMEELFRMGFACIRAGYFADISAIRRIMEKCGMKRTPMVEEIEYRNARHKVYYKEIRGKN